jgi:hypothetical protein
MKRTLTTTAVGGLFGFLLGLGLATGAYKENAQKLALGGLGSLLGGLTVHIIYSGKIAKAERDSEKKLDDAISELKATDNKEKQKLTTQHLTSINELKVRYDQEKNSQLSKQSKQIIDLTQQHGIDETVIAKLKADVKRLEISLKEHQQEVAKLTQENYEWDKNFNQGITDKIKEIRNQELRKIFDDHDKVVESYRQVIYGFKDWVAQVRDKNKRQREFILGATEQYNETLGNYAKDCEEVQDNQLTQIDILKLKIAKLEMLLQGDFSEPIYLESKHHQPSLIADDIAREIFTQLRIPLKVEGVETFESGVTTVGYGFPKSENPLDIVEQVTAIKKEIAHRLKLCKITNVQKLSITDCITISFRREPVLKEAEAKQLIGTPQEFIDYVINNPVRYRIMANPGQGKTPSMAVMIAEIIRAGGCKQMNMANGQRMTTLIDVAYPDAYSSAKDAANYPLKPFLKYGDTTAAFKSFSDAADDWEYRKRNNAYSSKFFQLWCWEEFDYTCESVDDPDAITSKLKLLLQKGGHNNIGYIVSGQTIMTKAIKGFTNDDRALFTEMVIGADKIRTYLETYGKKRNSDAQLAKLEKALDDIEEYVDDQNSKIFDSARYLRLALIRDDRSPKLYFLPNLDLAVFNIGEIQKTQQQALDFKRQNRAESPADSPAEIPADPVEDSHNPLSEPFGIKSTCLPFPTMGGIGQNADFGHNSASTPHCLHCDSNDLSLQKDKRYLCKGCKKRFASSKAIWK